MRALRPPKVEGASEFVEGMKAEYGEDAPGTFAADATTP